MAERLAPSSKHVFSHQGRTVYEWDQTLTEVNMYIPVPPDLRAKEIFCDITKQHLKFGRQGNPPFMDVRAFQPQHSSHACLRVAFIPTMSVLLIQPAVAAHSASVVSSPTHGHHACTPQAHLLVAQPGMPKFSCRPQSLLSLAAVDPSWTYGRR